MGQDEGGQRIRSIINGAIDQLVGEGLSRPDALGLMAFQCVLRLGMADEDAKLLEVREQLLAEIDLNFTPCADETTQ